MQGVSFVQHTRNIAFILAQHGTAILINERRKKQN